jgi:hypothetical protein
LPALIFWINSLPFAENRGKDWIEMSMCVIDNGTGEILADPFWSTRYNGVSYQELLEVENFNYQLHSVGSCFKPLLTLPILLEFPSLLNFKLAIGDNKSTHYGYNGDSLKATILGFPTEAFMKKSREGNNGWLDGSYSMSDYFTYSQDVYPVALTLIGLSKSTDPALYNYASRDLPEGNQDLLGIYRSNPTNTINRFLLSSHNTSVVRGGFYNSTISKLIDTIYGVKDLRSSSDKNILYDNSCWNIVLKGLRNRKAINYCSPEMVSINSDKIGINGIPATQSIRGVLVPWVLGQGVNEWNNIKMCEAFSRLVTKREVKAKSFAWNNIDTIPMVKLVAASNVDSLNRHLIRAGTVDSTWNTFLKVFNSAAQRPGKLLFPAYQSLTTAVSSLAGKIPDSLTILCKTGTPDNHDYTNYDMLENYGKQVWEDEGMFVFSILPKQVFKEITNDKNSNVYYDKAGRNGITAFIYLKHYSVKKPASDALNSTFARNFLFNNPTFLQQFLLFNKRSL